MKRYQCIKNFYESELRGLPVKRGRVLFLQGRLYNGDRYGTYIFDGLGNRHRITPEISACLQELLDLHVEDVGDTYWEHDSHEQYVLTEPAPIVKWLGWIAAILFTLIALWGLSS